MVTWALLMLPITVPSGEVSSTSNVSSASSRWSWIISVCQLLFDTPIQTESFLHPSLQCDFSFLCFFDLILSIHPEVSHLWCSKKENTKFLATSCGLSQQMEFAHLSLGLVVILWPKCGILNISDIGWLYMEVVTLFKEVSGIRCERPPWSFSNTSIDSGRWPLIVITGCWEWFWSGVHRHLMLSLVRLVSCPGSLLFFWRSVLHSCHMK